MPSKIYKFSESYQRGYTQKYLNTTYLLIVTAAGTTVLNIIINPGLMSFVTFSITILETTAIIWRRNLNGIFNILTKLNRHYKIATPTYIFLGTSLFLNILSTPAKAQFFQNAETWMTSQFTGAGEAIPLVFNVLRGLFLLYLGISLVKVIQASRQDEDWQNLARTPMIILIAVTIGDILANLIIGGGGVSRQ